MVPHRFAPTTLVVTLGLLLTVLGVFPAFAAQPDPARMRLELAARPEPVVQGAAAARQELEQDHGARWQVEVDPITGVAARGVGGLPGAGSPIAEAAARQAADAFRARHAALLGAATTTLRQVRWEASPRAWHATWQQVVSGRPVEGCYLDLLLAEDGDPVAFQSTLVPDLELPAPAPDLDGARHACEGRTGEPLEIETSESVGVVRPDIGRYTGVAALRLELRGRFGARWSALVDTGTHQVLELESRIRNELLQGTVTADIKPLYSQDTSVSRTLPWLRIGAGDPEERSTWSDGAGGYRFNLTPGNILLRAPLTGQYVHVDNEVGPSPGVVHDAAVPSTTELHFGLAEAREDERTIYYHVNVVHDFAKNRFGFDLLDFPLPAVASVHNPSSGNPNYANAFWDGSRLAFGNGGGIYENFGLFADVIYHEYMHAITDYMYRPVGGLRGAIGAAIHEALSDYFACTITDEPLVGEYLSGGFGSLRDLENSLRWPENRDPSDEEHRNGEILGGALWSVRMRTGPDVADPIIHFAREQYPQDFESYLEAMLVEDDILYGDGAPGNGSPHRDAILAGFADHGMGPLADQPIRISHTPLRDVEQEGMPRRVVADAGWALVGTTATMTLHWSTGATWTTQAMQADDTGGFSGEIPAQPAGTDVRYWLDATRTRPYEQHRLPETAPDSVFAYHVGPDVTPPSVTHAPHQQFPAFSWPAELAIRIDDNLGVAHAFVEYTVNGGSGAILGAARSPDDPTLYRARFTGTGVVPGDVVEYWITAVDASRSANATRLPSSGSFQVEVVDNLDEDFETGVPAWQHHPVVAGRPDPWHLTSSANHTAAGIYAWWCGLEAGEYPIGTAADLVTDWYRLGDGARASIWSWMDAEVNVGPLAFDGGIVEIQAEGNLGWEPLAPIGGYTHTMSPTSGTNYIEPGTPCLSGYDTDWRQLEFDLATWAGQRVRLRFLFASDGSPYFTPLRGWKLDDFFLDPGTRNPTDTTVPEPPVATRLLVRPPSPNPFNPTLVFQLDVPQGAEHVRLDIFDMRGRVVARLLDAEPAPGPLRIVWEARDPAGRTLPSGVYVYRLVSSLGTQTGKAVLLR